MKDAYAAPSGVRDWLTRAGRLFQTGGDTGPPARTRGAGQG